MKPLKPSELSVGNLLNYDTGEGVELYVIDWQDLKLLEEKPEWFNELHTPVPLSPEILEEFGFEVYDDDLFTCFQMKYKRIVFTIKISKISAKLNKIHWPMGVSTLPIHAHTLQNFVQSISGVELVYKQNKTD